MKSRPDLGLSQEQATGWAERDEDGRGRRPGTAAVWLSPRVPMLLAKTVGLLLPTALRHPQMNSK